MQLGHLLTRSALTYPEVLSKVYHKSFSPLGSSVDFLQVIITGIVTWVCRIEFRSCELCSRVFGSA